MKNRLLLSTILLLMSCSISGAKELTLSDVVLPQSPAYRVGISDVPENQYVEPESDNLSVEKLQPQISSEQNIADLTYADLSIKTISKEIANELLYEEEGMVADLSLLWQGAAMQSDTINFALYKLSNPDADKPNEKSVKKVLTTIASMSTIVGAGISNPMIATSSILGGNLLSIMGQDTKALNYKYTKVNDADMIILVRKIEDLQQKTIDLYYDYMTSRHQLDLMTNLAEERKNKFELVQKNNAPRELVVIIDAYYRTALDRQKTAQSDFYVKRAALEQFVGHDTFMQFEAELAQRQKQTDEQTSENLTVEQQEEYSNTIEQVKNFNGVKEKTNAPIPTVSKNNSNPYIYNEPEFWSEYSNSDAVTGFASKISKSQAPVPTSTKKIKEKVKKLEKNKPVKEKKVKLPKQKKEKITKTNIKKEKPIKAKKEKIIKEKKIKEKISKPKKEKVKKENKFINFFKDERASYYDVQPHKTYPKNSTKDLIFLHDKDKQTAVDTFRKRQQGIEIPQEETKKEQKEVAQSKGIETLWDKLPEIEPVADGVYAPNSLPADNSNNYVKTSTPTYNEGFMPLDEIRIPDLSRNGYSIHSDSEF